MIFYCRNVAFFAGSVLAVLVVLTVIDEDVLNVEHVLTIMTIAGEFDSYKDKNKFVRLNYYLWGKYLFSNKIEW